MSLKACWLLLLVCVLAGCSDKHDAIEALRSKGATVRIDAKGDAYWIDLSRCRLDESLHGHLAQTEHVKTLVLAGSQVTDADASLLESLSEIETLDLSYSKISPATIQSLHGLSRLTTLSLNGMTITDEIVAELQRLRLRGLSLMQAEITPENLERLKESNPGCVIMYEAVGG